MTWTRLPDDFTDRPEMLEVSRSARLLHVEALVWCNRLLSDGRLPKGALPRISDSPDPEADVTELVKAGLWEPDADRGWRIDWTDQEAADNVRERQAARAQTQKRYRERQAKHVAGDHSMCDPRFCRGAVTGNATGNATSHMSGYETPSRTALPRPEGEGQGQGARTGVADAPPAAAPADQDAAPVWPDHDFAGTPGGPCRRVDGITFATCYLPADQHRPAKRRRG